jgi:hypothetical protein
MPGIMYDRLSFPYYGGSTGPLHRTFGGRGPDNTF